MPCWTVPPKFTVVCNDTLNPEGSESGGTSELIAPRAMSRMVTLPLPMSKVAAYPGAVGVEMEPVDSKSALENT